MRKIDAFVEKNKNCQYIVFTEIDVIAWCKIKGIGNSINEAQIDFLNTYQSIKKEYKGTDWSEEIVFNFIYNNL